MVGTARCAFAHPTKLCRPRSGRDGRQLLAAIGDEANAGEAEQHQQQFGLTRAEAALVEEMLNAATCRRSQPGSE
jgi:hypothetical protein